MIGNCADSMPHYTQNEDMAALKNWVEFDPQTVNRSASTVLLHVSHSNLKRHFHELRLDRHMSVLRVKEKLAFHTGTSAGMAFLSLLDGNNQMISDMEDDKMLGYYSPQDGWTIHITDLDPYSLAAGGGLEDVSLVEKYEINEEKYMARSDNFRKFKAGKVAEDPSWTLEKETRNKKIAKNRERDPNYDPDTDPNLPPLAPAKVTDPEHGADLAAKMKVGDRCQVQPGDRRGEVKYVGQVDCLIGLGWWVGVQYDEPVGKNDGSVKGQRFFECPEKYGGFVRPDKVETGDFPEVDEFALTDDEEDCCASGTCTAKKAEQAIGELSLSDHDHSHGHEATTQENKENDGCQKGCCHQSD